MTSKSDRLSSHTPDVAGNGLLNRRALLGRGVLFAGAAVAGTGSALTGAAAEQLPVDPWSKGPGEKIPAYGVPAKYESKVIRTLKTDGPTPEEVQKARSYLAGQFPLGLQAPDELAGQLLDIEYFGLDLDYLQTFGDKVGAVAMEDCRRALKSYFCTDDLKLLVVTNPDAGKAALVGLGEITVKEAR